MHTSSSFSFFQPTIVANCPRSLKCLITYYRCLGFTFTGVVFTGQHQQFLPNKSRRKLKVFSRLFLFWHLFFLLNTALFASSSLVEKYLWPTVIGEMNRSPFNQYGRLMKYSVDKYNYEFANFKAILRGSLALIGHVFVGDSLLNYALNLLYGRRFLELVLAVPNIRKLDESASLGAKLILLPLVFHFAGILFALVTFARPYFLLLVSWIFRSSSGLSSQQLEDVGQILVIVFIWPQYFSLQLKSTVIYYYLMGVFSGNLLLICRSVEQSENSLDDKSLVAVRRQLQSLAGHLEQINELLSPALSWALVGSVHLLVATVCYFVVLNKGHSNHHYYSVILFACLLFALLKLILLSVAGSRPPAAYEQLLLVLYENIARDTREECSLQTWLTYQKLRQMESRFRSRLCWDAFELSQASLVAILEAALSYIIILLQTEDSW